MYLDPKSELYGYPALAVRDLLRTFPGSDCAWYPPRETKKLTLQQATELSVQLHADGLLEPHPGAIESGEKPYYATTEKGLRLANASGRLFRRKRVEQELRALLERAQQINDGPFLCRVTAIVVYGSYLSDKERLGDLDIAFHTEDKELDDEEMIALYLACQRRAPRDLSGTMRLFWPDTEVARKLRGRSGIVSLVSLFGHMPMLTDRCPHRVLVPEGATLADLDVTSRRRRDWFLKAVSTPWDV